MLFNPSRKGAVRRLFARLAGLWRARRDADAAVAVDLRYLDSMSAKRLEADLGLRRGEDGRYRF